MTNNAQLKQVLVRMPDDLHEAIKDRAASEDLSMAQAIRRAVREYLVEPQPIDTRI